MTSFPTIPDAANFRSGDLVQGQPLGGTDLTVMLSANNMFVNPQYMANIAPVSVIHLQSNNTTATNRVFTLANGQFGDQQLFLVFESGSSNTCKLTNTGNVALSADWTPVLNGTLSLVWDLSLGAWVEQSRSPVSVGSVGNGVITIPMFTAPVMQEVSGHLTQANILAMFTTPVNVIAAPGAGYVIIVDEVELYHAYSTTVYATGTTPKLTYDTSGTVIELFATTLLTAASSTEYVTKPSVYDVDAVTGANGFNIGAEANHGIDFTNATAAFTGGNAANLLYYRIRYHTVQALSVVLP